MPLVFHLGNSQVSVYRTIGPTLVVSVAMIVVRCLLGEEKPVLDL